MIKRIAIKRVLTDEEQAIKNKFHLTQQIVRIHYRQRITGGRMRAEMRQTVCQEGDSESRAQEKMVHVLGEQKRNIFGFHQ